MTTDNDVQLGEEFRLECSDQAAAELGREREYKAEQALLAFHRLILLTSHTMENPNWNHLRTLCYECGIDYDRLIAHR